MIGFLKLFGSKRGKGRFEVAQVKIHEENFMRGEPIRVPYCAARFSRKGIGRCNGRKPKYKNVRRGFGRPTVDIMIF